MKNIIVITMSSILVLVLTACGASASSSPSNSSSGSRIHQLQYRLLTLPAEQLHQAEALRLRQVPLR